MQQKYNHRHTPKNSLRRLALHVFLDGANQRRENDGRKDPEQAQCRTKFGIGVVQSGLVCVGCHRRYSSDANRPPDCYATNEERKHNQCPAAEVEEQSRASVNARQLSAQISVHTDGCEDNDQSSESCQFIQRADGSSYARKHNRGDDPPQPSSAITRSWGHDGRVFHADMKIRETFSGKECF